jgi:Putative peptidoglycan binding domain
MSTAPAQAPAGTAARATRLGRRRRGSQIAIVACLAVVLAAGGAVIALKHPFRGAGQAGTPLASSEDPTSLYTVTRQTLTSQTPVNATLGYAGSYSINGQGSGTLTWLPAAGQVISQGGVLYRADNSPVFLLYGPVPVYREMSDGLSGPDVQQLNSDLVALGYASKSELNPDSDSFSAQTADALYLLQAHLGLTPTGSLPMGQAVFEPSAIRVTTVPGGLGSPASGQVLQATSDQRIVTVPLATTEESDVQTGDKVTITLPTGQTTTGVVTSVGTVATTPSGGGTPTVTVNVTPSNPAATGNLDQAPVQVSITTATVPDALVVPVDALLAEPGGYAVEEVPARGGRRMVPVTLGLTDQADGLVQVTGAGLAAGQRVVVPAL